MYKKLLNNSVKRVMVFLSVVFLPDSIKNSKYWQIKFTSLWFQVFMLVNVEIVKLDRGMQEFVPHATAHIQRWYQSSLRRHSLQTLQYVFGNCDVVSRQRRAVCTSLIDKSFLQCGRPLIQTSVI